MIRFSSYNISSLCAMNVLGCGKNISVMATTTFNKAEVDAAREVGRVKQKEEENAEGSGSVLR